MVKSLGTSESYLMREQKVNRSLDTHAMGSEEAASHSLTMLRPLDQETLKLTSYFAERKNNSMFGAQYENSLFSSSLSDLFCRKLGFSSNNDLYGHSVNSIASHHDGGEPFESLDQIEAQTIGDLLPDDDDLLSGVVDGLDFIAQPSNVDDKEEIDLFSSVGGMDLGDDGISAAVANGQLGISRGSIVGGHPSRALFVRNINSIVEDSELRALFEQYGDIQSLDTAGKHRGFAMIYYYDIRAAQNAMKALQNRPSRHGKLDIHYTIRKDNPSEKYIGQGTLVVYNLDTSVSNNKLHEIFGVYGEIMEIHETPDRDDHKFIEFYDVRAAEAALQALNGIEIAGKQIKVEHSCPGGPRRLVQRLASELDHNEHTCFLQQNSPPSYSNTGFSGQLLLSSTSSNMDNGNIRAVTSTVRMPMTSLLESGFHQHHGISCSVPNGLQSLLRYDSVCNKSCLAESVQSQGPLKFDIHRSPTYQPHSLPEYHDGMTSSSSLCSMATNISQRQEMNENGQFCRVRPPNGHTVELNHSVFGGTNGSSPVPGHHFPWSDSSQPHQSGTMWSNLQSHSFVTAIGSPNPLPQLHGFCGAPSHIRNPVLSVSNHHVGSAPTVNPLWDRQHTYAAESPKASGFHPGSLESMRMSNNSLHSMDFVSTNIFPHVAGNCIDLPIPYGNGGFQSHQPRRMMFSRRGQTISLMSSFDPPSERARNRRNEGNYNQAENKKQFELDIDRIIRGEDNRTTLMIKNIPNKYTSKMLLAAIDEHHKGTYDFIYLPIDFKNKCNVGYAFINMTDPKHIIPFYQTFDGKKWEKFNSEKVASLAYARIQGKAALIAHFQNSSLMNEDKRCRPILFNTEGPNAGDQVPFPMGVNVRTRLGRVRTNTQEESYKGSPFDLDNEKISINKNSFSVSSKELDGGQTFCI